MLRLVEFGHLLFSTAFARLASLPKFCAVLIVALAATGCASIKLDMQDEAADATAISHQREVLADAAFTMKQTPWPMPSERSTGAKMMSLLFGADERTKDGTGEGHQDGAAISREAACKTYLRQISDQNGDARKRLLADADITLRHARAVAETGRITSQSLYPTRDDVIILETAISDLQESRDMYVLSLKLLKKQGGDVSSDDISELRKAFSQTIVDIGRVADVVADKAAANNRKQFAQPAMVSQP